MPSHETIYLSFGTFANHITTSFFNEQASYLGTKNDEVVDSTVALAEGPGFSTGLDSEPQLYPRALMFDVQDQIGSLAQRTGVTEDEELLLGQHRSPGNNNNDDDDDDDVLDRYNASATSGAELIDTIPDFSTFLPSKEDQAEQDRSAMAPPRPSRKPPLEYDLCAEEEQGEIRAAGNLRRLDSSRAPNLLWSDYQQFYLHPKSVVSVKGGPMQGPCSALIGSTAQQIRRTRRTPGPSEPYPEEEEDDDEEDESGALVMDGFEAGYAVAKDMDTETDVFEDRLRWLAEDSDALQSINMTTTTTDAFSGMSHAYMEHVADEYAKVPVTAWGATWRLPWRFGMTPQTLFDVDNLSSRAVRRGMTRSMNFALSLGLLTGHENGIFTPLLPPTLSEDALSFYHPNNMFDVSSLLAAHVETATLPTRLFSSMTGAEAAGSLVNRLNWRQDTHLANLSGAMPIPELPVDKCVASINDPVQAALAEFRARRGLGPSNEDHYNTERLPPHVAAQRQAERVASHLRPHWIDMSNGLLRTPEGSKASQLAATVLPFSQSLVVRDARAPARERLIHALRHICSSSEQEVLQEPFSSYVGLETDWNVSRGFPPIFSGLDVRGVPAQLRSNPAPGGAFGVMDVPPDLDLSDPAALANLIAPKAATQSDQRTQPRSVPMASGLSTSPAPTAYMLRCAQSVIKAAINRPEAMLREYGLGNGADEGIVGARDGLKEIYEGLEGSLEAYEAGLPEGYEQAFEPSTTAKDDGRDQDEDWEEEEVWDI